MERIQIAIAEILLKQDMSISFTYRNIGKKYNVAERTLRYFVRKYGRKQPDLDNFFIRMLSRSYPPRRTHLRQMMDDIKALSARNYIFNKSHTNKQEREKEMAEGAMAGDETCYDEDMREQEELRIKNLQEKWNKDYLRTYEKYEMEPEDLDDFEHLIIGNF